MRDLLKISSVATPLAEGKEPTPATRVLTCVTSTLHCSSYTCHPCGGNLEERITSLPKRSAIWMTVRWMEDPGQENNQETRQKRSKYTRILRPSSAMKDQSSMPVLYPHQTDIARKTKYTVLLLLLSFLVIWPDKTQIVVAQPAHCASHLIAKNGQSLHCSNTTMTKRQVDITISISAF